ncbi:MAG: sigma-70 family RNA polymerase sigma factor [Agathobacter sp.]|nr:sigma-70 family RNA polymerase sigma factor [Agathobacter sp.]
MNEIYQQYANSVYRFLLSKTRNEDIAEELTQETFYQAIRSINKFDGSCKLSTWLFGIAKNQYFNYSRKNPILQDVSEYEEKLKSNENVDEKIISSFERVDMIRALHECKEPYREVLYQRIFGNLSFREIGDVLGKSENWARVTYYRGKEQLKKEIDFLKKNRKHLETILGVTIGLAISIAIAGLIFALQLAKHLIFIQATH